MIHKMRLFDRPFELIKSGQKILEIRLNDEKRQKVKIGDIIEFAKLSDSKEKIQVKVLGLNRFDSFRKLYEEMPPCHYGCEGMSIEDLMEFTNNIYTREDESKWGALAIRIERLLIN